MSFSQEVLIPALQARRLLCQDVLKSHQQALARINQKPLHDWAVSLGDHLIFDFSGLNVIKNALQSYQGTADQLNFRLQLSEPAIRDYYSHSTYLASDGLINLPIIATRNLNRNEEVDTYLLTFDELSTPINYPQALTERDVNSTPLALLMPYSCDHDLLFSNQIALFSNINQQVRKSPRSWLNAFFKRRTLFKGRNISLNQRISLSWKQVHPSADVHPTAVIEGSVIGEGCRVGAHCVVRYSLLGNNVHLHDGAKVEYSVLDDNSWLMHDLVLYRSLAETDVFLIHGPYQFSFFQKGSGAFANIMMDYRPDNKPIRINTPINKPSGVCDYQGRFLGALLEERAKVFGGTLTAPGITIPHDKQITADIDAITTAKTLAGKALKESLIKSIKF